MCRRRVRAAVRERGREHMELKLSGGAYALGQNHAPVEIDGKDELAQRVACRLSVHRGTFLPMPTFGSRLWTLGRVGRAERETAARRFVLEALEDETGLVLDSLSLEEKAGGDAILRLELHGESGAFSVETEI